VYWNIAEIHPLAYSFKSATVDVKLTGLGKSTQHTGINPTAS
jgi:hypothetical protein